MVINTIFTIMYLFYALFLKKKDGEIPSVNWEKIVKIDKQQYLKIHTIISSIFNILYINNTIYIHNMQICKQSHQYYLRKL